MQIAPFLRRAPEGEVDPRLRRLDLLAHVVDLLLHALHNALVVLQQIGVDLRIRHRTLADQTGLRDRRPIAREQNASLATPLE